MKLFQLAAIIGGTVSTVFAQPEPHGHQDSDAVTTAVVYQTSTMIVTECAADATKCPERVTTQVTTTTVLGTTTKCPFALIPGGQSSSILPTGPGNSSESGTGPGLTSIETAPTVTSSAPFASSDLQSGPPVSATAPANSSTSENNVPASLTAPPILSRPSSSGVADGSTASYPFASISVPFSNSTQENHVPNSLTAPPIVSMPTSSGFNTPEISTALPSFVLGTSSADSNLTSLVSSIPYGSIPVSGGNPSTFSAPTPSIPSTLSGSPSTTFDPTPSSHLSPSTLSDSIPTSTPSISNEQSNLSTFTDSIPTSIGSTTIAEPSSSSSSPNSDLSSEGVSQTGTTPTSPAGSSQEDSIPSQTSGISISLPTDPSDSTTSGHSQQFWLPTDPPLSTTSGYSNPNWLPTDPPLTQTSGVNSTLSEGIIWPTSLLTQPVGLSVTEPISQDPSTSTDGALISGGTGSSSLPSGTGYPNATGTGNQTVISPTPTYTPLIINVGSVVGAGRSSIAAIVVAFAFVHFC